LGVEIEVDEGIVFCGCYAGNESSVGGYWEGAVVILCSDDVCCIRDIEDVELKVRKGNVER